MNGIGKRKIRRLSDATKDTKKFLDDHPRTKSTNFFFLSGLYLGEGGKSDIRVSFANSGPLIIKCFIKIFREMFSPIESKFTIQLHIRYDQNGEKLNKYWSSITQIPIGQFQKVQVDVRTKSKPTYGDYHGVCAIYYCDAKIQRFLLELQQQYICSVLKE